MCIGYWPFWNGNLTQIFSGLAFAHRRTYPVALKATLNPAAPFPANTSQNAENRTNYANQLCSASYAPGKSDELMSDLNVHAVVSRFSIVLFLAINIVLVIIPIVQEFEVTSLGIGICIVGFGLYFLLVHPTALPSALTHINGKYSRNT